MDSFFGVPAHPLFVHLPVVLTPMAALISLFMLRPEWRRSYSWVVTVLSGVALLGAQLAVASGELLEERVTESEAVEFHAQLGEATRLLVALFFAASLALTIYVSIQRRGHEERSRSTPWIAWVLTGAMIFCGTLATGWVVRTGHQGAKITWDEVTEEGAGAPCCSFVPGTPSTTSCELGPTGSQSVYTATVSRTSRARAKSVISAKKSRRTSRCGLPRGTPLAGNLIRSEAG